MLKKIGNCNDVYAILNHMASRRPYGQLGIYDICLPHPIPNPTFAICG